MARDRAFDVSYGLASASLTAGDTIVSTVGANYHGAAIIAGTTARATIIVYDSISATTGNIVDMFVVEGNDSIWIDRTIPVVAKVGLVIAIAGVGAKGAVFYGPKG